MSQNQIYAKGLHTQLQQKHSNGSHFATEFEPFDSLNYVLDEDKQSNVFIMSQGTQSHSNTILILENGSIYHRTPNYFKKIPCNHIHNHLSIIDVVVLIHYFSHLMASKEYNVGQCGIATNEW
eukprot:211388_1